MLQEPQVMILEAEVHETHPTGQIVHKLVKEEE